LGDKEGKATFQFAFQSLEGFFLAASKRVMTTKQCLKLIFVNWQQRFKLDSDRGFKGQQPQSNTQETFVCKNVEKVLW
jgi:hypothetical protein